MNGPNGSRRTILESEFARVSVEIASVGNGDRLRVEDCQTGASILLDPLELYSLVWARHEDLRAVLDPSKYGE